MPKLRFQTAFVCPHGAVSVLFGVRPVGGFALPVHFAAAEQGLHHVGGFFVEFAGFFHQGFVGEGGDFGVVEFGQGEEVVAVAGGVEVAQFFGAFLRYAEAFEGDAAAADGGVEGFAHDEVGAGVVQVVGVLAAVGAGDDGEVGVVAADEFDDFGGLFVVADSNDQEFGFAQADGVEQLGAGGVAVVGFAAVFGEPFDGFGVEVDDGGVEAAAGEHAVDLLAEAAVAEQDDGVFFVHFVVGAALVFFGDAARGDDFVVEDEQQGGEQHGEGDDEGDAVGECVRQDAVLVGDGQQYEAEFAGLREAEGEEFAGGGGQAEQFAEDEEYEGFEQHGAEGEAEYQREFFAQQTEVHARADGDEEEAEQQPFEGFEVAFHFVAVGAVGQRDAGDERAQRGGEADEGHEGGDADDQREGEQGEHFAQAGFADEAEGGGHEVAHADDDDGDGGHAYEGGYPAGLSGQDVGGFVAVLRLGGGGAQEGQQGEHGDGGHVLKQQYGKARLTARRGQQVFLAEGLQYDGGGRQSQYAADCHADLPGLPQGDGQPGNGGQCQHDLQAAQPQEFVPQPPQHLRGKFQTDQKQHHDHAEFGHVLDGFGLFADQAEHRPDHDARHQVAEHRPQAQFLRGQNDGNGKRHVNEGVQQYFGHGLFFSFFNVAGGKREICGMAAIFSDGLTRA